MAPSGTTVPSLRAEFMIREIDAAKVVGVPARELCRTVGLDLDKLADPVARVPIRQIAQVYEEAARLSGDDALGLHVGERAAPGVVDLVDYAFISRPTLARAYEELYPLLAPLYPEAEVSLTVAEDVAAFRYRLDPREASLHRHRSEALVAGLVKLAERAIGRPDSLMGVSFQHPRPRDAAEHARVFRVPVQFGWPANEIAFAARWLDAPLATADANLCTVLDRHLQDLVARMPSARSFSHDVRRRLALVFRSGPVSLPSLARSLGVSERTLQRRLREEGTSLQEIVEGVRAELSLSLLRDSELSIAEVADRLGYGSLGAFARAFRRWRGASPAAYRRALRGAG